MSSPQEVAATADAGAELDDTPVLNNVIGAWLAIPDFIYNFTLDTASQLQNYADAMQSLQS